jgi:hypothetical protein
MRLGGALSPSATTPRMSLPSPTRERKMNALDLKPPDILSWRIDCAAALERHQTCAPPQSLGEAAPNKHKPIIKANRIIISRLNKQFAY